MKFIKSLLFLIGSLFCPDDKMKVVFYHDIGTTYTPMGTPEFLFWSHMECLRQVKVKGEGEEMIAHHSPTPTLHSNSHIVAFDDGFRGIWDNRESMRLFDVRPVVFIAIALVGQPGYLSWDEIRILQNDYGVNFQCHTWSHQTLIGPVNTDLPPPPTPDFRTDAWYHHELVDSKNELEKQLGKKIDAICFPVGYFSDAVLNRCVDAGYTNLYASFPGNLKDDANSIVHLHLSPSPVRLLPRILCQDLSLFSFKCVLRGGMNALCQRYFKRHYCK